MSNLISRLIMDASQYDGGLQKAQKSLDRFLDKNLSVSNVMKDLAGNITKVAGAMGIAMGAQEALTRVIQGSQTTGDAYTRVMDQAKASVDSFFAAASMGDMSRFTENLQSVIDKARELSIELDNLGTMELYNRANMRELNAQYQIELNASKNRSKSDKERLEHLKNARKILGQMNKKDITLGETKEGVSYKMLNAEMAKQGFGVGIDERTWNFLLNSDRRPMIDEGAQKYKSTIDDYTNRIFAAKVTDTFTGAALDTEESRALQKELDDYKKSTAGLVGNMYYTFTEIADDTNSAVAKALDLKASSKELEAAVSARELEVGNVEAKIKGSYNKQHGITGSGTGSKKEAPLIYNYDQLNEQIKIAISGKDAASKKILEAVETGKTLPILTQPIQAITVNSEDEKVEGEDPYESLRSKLEMYTIAQDKIQELTDMLSIANGEEKAYLLEQIDIWTKYANELDGVYSKKKKMEELTGGIDQMSSALSQLGAAAGGTFGGMLGWLGNVMGTIPGAIEAIDKLTHAKDIETAANIKNAASGAASSVASIPIVGPMLAAAAVASVLAAIMSVPSSFAEGGVVIGGSNYMDGITARVSSGEMIMNEADQKKLYNAIHTGNLGGGSSRTVVTGEQIVTVVNNYGKRTGKGVILKG